MNTTSNMAKNLNYNEFFNEVADSISNLLPPGLQHFKSRHDRGKNWIVIRFPEFKYSQFELHLARQSDHHKAYFGEDCVNVVAFYFGGTGVGSDKKEAWLNTISPYRELISQQLGHPVVSGVWSENWVWLAMRLSDWTESQEMAKIYSRSLVHFIEATYTPISKAFSVIESVHGGTPDFETT